MCSCKAWGNAPFSSKREDVSLSRIRPSQTIGQALQKEAISFNFWCERIASSMCQKRFWLPCKSLESKQTHLAGRLPWPGRESVSLHPEGRAQGVRWTSICRNPHLPAENGLKMKYCRFGVFQIYYLGGLSTVCLPAPLPTCQPFNPPPLISAQFTPPLAHFHFIA